MAALLYRWSTEDGVYEVLGSPENWYVEFGARRTNGTLDPMEAAGRLDVAWPAIEEVLRLAVQRQTLRNLLRRTIPLVPCEWQDEILRTMEECE